MKAGDTTCSVPDTYPARTARKRARTVRKRFDRSDDSANDRSDSPRTTQGVAYLARNLKFESANHRFLTSSVSSVYGRGSSSSSSTWSGSERTLDVMRWGLVPFWAKDIKVGFANINGKAEGTRRPRPWEATQARTLRVPAGRDL